MQLLISYDCLLYVSDLLILNHLLHNLRIIQKLNHTIMKKDRWINRFKLISLSLLLFLLSSLPAQSQSGFSYQAIARDNAGELLSSQGISVRFIILSEESDETIWQESHDVITNEFGLFTVVVGGTDGYGKSGMVESFDAIDWSATQYSLKIMVKVDGEFIDLGSAPIHTVPVAQFAKTAKNSSGSFSVQADQSSAEGEALFEVRRADGSVAFAVYEDMVWVYVDTAATKGVKGGFAVGGYNRSKSSPNEFLRVTPDSIRMYINTEQTKGVKGGFAVGGYNTSKAANDQFLYVSGNDAVEIVDDKAQVLWYPRKEAFLAGNIYIPHPDSVGQNAIAMGYKSIASGNWSQAFGYRSRALGNYSTAIGREAVAGFSSFAFGNRAKALGDISYAFGSGSEASGSQSFALGVNSLSTNDYAVAIGFEAEASGAYSTAIGFRANASGNSSFSSGRLSQATAPNSISFGNGAISSGIDAASIGFQSQALGEKSIAIGSHYEYTFNSLPFFNFTGKNEGAKGDFDFIILDPIITPIFRTVTFNRANIAEGKYSISLGNGNYSSNGGMALGSNNDANGFGAVSLGMSNKAINTNSFAAGYSSMATGYYATAIGNNAYAKSYGSFVIGQYNDNGTNADSTKWVNTDPLFIVGNGLNSDNRNNALTIYKNGRSIFKGEDANLTLNDRRTFFNIVNFTTTLNVYGIRSYVNRANPDVDNYYSGYFFDTGAEGAYQGFYADVRSGGSIDVAEYIYDTEGTTEPGDLLIADPDKKESVVVSSEPYQSAVVGIVSTDPHLTMGMELVIDEVTGSAIPGVKATRLALTGRVPCKVTDENGAIQPGDLLTTSSTPGHAMKWRPVDLSGAKDFEELKQMLTENEMRRHAVVGKALEAHDSGTGKIMVLISLQ